MSGKRRVSVTGADILTSVRRAWRISWWTCRPVSDNCRSAVLRRHLLLAAAAVVLCRLASHRGVVVSSRGCRLRRSAVKNDRNERKAKRSLALISARRSSHLPIRGRPTWIYDDMASGHRRRLMANRRRSRAARRVHRLGTSRNYEHRRRPNTGDFAGKHPYLDAEPSTHLAWIFDV